jgi:hypothetical protein
MQIEWALLFCELMSKPEQMTLDGNTSSEMERRDGGSQNGGRSAVQCTPSRHQRLNKHKTEPAAAHR